MSSEPHDTSSPRSATNAGSGNCKVKNGAHSDEGMRLLGEIYVIAIVFAFHKLSEALYEYFVNDVSWGPLCAKADPLLWVVTLPALTIITFGLRFFWCAYLIKLCIDEYDLRNPFALGFSVAILLFQAFVIYFLAAILGVVVQCSAAEDEALKFLLWSAMLVFANGLWLGLVPYWHSDGLLFNKICKWALINTLFGLGGIAVWWAWPNWHRQDWTDNCLLGLTGAFYLANSIIDFSTTWPFYFLSLPAESELRKGFCHRLFARTHLRS